MLLLTKIIYLIHAYFYIRPTVYIIRKNCYMRIILFILHKNYTALYAIFPFVWCIRQIDLIRHREGQVM
jgi:hypothetical protein